MAVATTIDIYPVDSTAPSEDLTFYCEGILYTVAKTAFSGRTYYDSTTNALAVGTNGTKQVTVGLTRSSAPLALQHDYWAELCTSVVNAPWRTSTGLRKSDGQYVLVINSTT